MSPFNPSFSPPLHRPCMPAAGTLALGSFSECCHRCHQSLQSTTYTLDAKLSDLQKPVDEHVPEGTISCLFNAVLSLLPESVDAHQRSFDVGIHIGYQRRNKDVLAWVKKRRRTIRREDLISFLCGKAPPPRNSRAPPRLTVVSPNRAASTETSSSVETDLQPFREAIALHGLSGAMASISVRSSTPGSPTHVSSGSNGSRRRNGLHDVDLNTFISEEMALHLDNGGTRKRTSAQCGDGITDSPTHKRNRMI
ncbi:hypothetical protein JD844_019534 [Phrynosoma platyrhinos]|uniref:CP072 protein n=1 Tax=Phrynosoma platyrhinos TaxID=52577 RepID=A0ABQ7TSK9_PHRPL|nr:hypothetical protein JD844_019534 [Phrynosoma platyrhinos]